MSQELLTINYRNTTNRDIATYPVTYGVPLAAGVLHEAANLSLQLPNGQTRPVQARALEAHSDGSIKWLLLDFEIPLEANDAGKLTLSEDDSDPAENTMSLEENAGAVIVTTPQLKITLSKAHFSLFASYQVNGHELVAHGSDIVLENLNGKRFYASLSKGVEVQIIEQGPQRIVVQVSGKHTAEDDSTLLDFRVRYTFRPNEPGVMLSYKFTNREEPETGVHVASMHLELPTTIGGTTSKLLRQTNHGKSWFSRLVEIRENVEIIAGKAVNEEAKTRYGAAAEGKILIRNMDSLREDFSVYPYFLRAGNARVDMTGGIRQMYPYVGANGANGSLLGWFYEMENNYPKGVRCERNSLFFDIWPSWAGNFNVRRGQSKEHDLFVSLCDTQREHAAMEGVYFDHEVVGVGIMGGGAPPLQYWLDAEYARSTEILDVHRWLRYDEDRYFAVEGKLGSLGAKGGNGTKGMMDIGDYVSPDRSWAHNNENDGLLDSLREYYRREEPTNLLPALTKARHNAHVDFIAYDPDPLRQGTMPAHCPEHTDGATYPSHMWVDGLVAAHGLTGNPDFIEVAISVGENMLRWQYDNPTIFYADSRECGWPMLAYLRLHAFTGEQRWLDACQEVFEYYRDHMGPDGEIKYALPHGVGTVLQGYGEFISWRAVFFYYERTGKEDVKAFLLESLAKVYHFRPGHMVGGWGCNDMFPAWALYTLSGDVKYLEDNYPFLRYLMDRREGFPWGGVDMHYYLAELDRLGVLEGFA